MGNKPATKNDKNQSAIATPKVNISRNNTMKRIIESIRNFQMIYNPKTSRNSMKDPNPSNCIISKDSFNYVDEGEHHEVPTKCIKANLMNQDKGQICISHDIIREELKVNPQLQTSDELIIGKMGARHNSDKMISFEVSNLSVKANKIKARATQFNLMKALFENEYCG